MNTEFERLARRVGHGHATHRLRLQKFYTSSEFSARAKRLPLVAVLHMSYVLRMLLRHSWLYPVGYRNYKSVVVRHNHVTIRELPPAFEGFTLAHLSDLHLDIDDTFVDVVIERLKNCHYDVAVITGDFCYKLFGPVDRAVEHLKGLRQALKRPMYAVLGNHDFIELVTACDDINLPVLVNESVAIRKQRDTIYLVGVDDPHFYKLDDLTQAMKDVPPTAVKILLAHSPEIYKKASEFGFQLALCGHTHGGQICLPGGWPIIVNTPCPFRYQRGKWAYRGVQGYTSVGTGSSGIPIRFFCPPEIVLHHLSRG